MDLNQGNDQEIKKKGGKKWNVLKGYEPSAPQRSPENGNKVSDVETQQNRTQSCFESLKRESKEIQSKYSWIQPLVPQTRQTHNWIVADSMRVSKLKF